MQLPQAVHANVAGVQNGIVSAALPEAVQRFLRRHIRSVGELEVLLLLARDPSRWWSAEAVNQELRASSISARQYLQELVVGYLVERRGVAQDSVFKFRPADEGIADVVRATAQLFKYRMPALVDCIYGHGAPPASQPSYMRRSDPGPFDRRR